MLLKLHCRVSPLNSLLVRTQNYWRRTQWFHIKAECLSGQNGPFSDAERRAGDFRK